jgi:tetratricopeptide (TPR) repeat protein
MSMREKAVPNGSTPIVRWVFNFSPAEGHVYLQRAVEKASELGDDAALFAAAGSVFLLLWQVRYLGFLENLVDKMVNRPQIGVKTADLATSLHGMARVLIQRGDRTDAERLWDELRHLVESRRDVSYLRIAHEGPVILACLDGRYDEAVSLLDAAEVLGASSGLSQDPSTAMVRWLILQRLAREGEQPFAVSPFPDRSLKALECSILAILGRHEEVAAIRHQSFPGVDEARDPAPNQIIAVFLEAAILAGDAATAAAISPQFEAMVDHIVVRTPLTSGARLLGGEARLAGRADKARAYYLRALEVCEKVRFRPEIALIRLDLAELLLEHYPDEHDAAIEHLDFAIAEFREMKMQPSLERALRHRGLLKA